MAGRKEDPVWNNYQKIKNENRAGYKAKCKDCGKTFEGIVKRLKTHQEKCTSAGSAVDDDVMNLEAGQVTEEGKGGTLAASTSTTTTSTTTTNKVRSQKQNNLDPFIVKTSLIQKDAIDLQIAKYIYATNSSFRSVEHKEFKEMVSLLRPGYSPPNRNTIGGKLLDKVYDDIKGEIRSRLQNNTICLSIDGWSNIHNEPILCVSAILDGQSFLVDTVDSSGHSHNADYLLEVVKTSIQTCQENYHCRVGSLVTDNASNMSKMRKDLVSWQEEKNSNNDISVENTIIPMVKFIAYGCSAHILNLLAHDLDMREIRAHVVSVMKYFRNTHLPAAKYKEEGGKKLVLPIDVRWNTTADCMESYIKNWPVLIKVCEENKDMVIVDIANKVKSFAIKKSAEDYLSLLKPLAASLDTLQRDSSLISDTCEIFLNLEEEIVKNKHMMEVMHAKFLSRKKMALTPVHYLANLLDPRYLGEKLSEENKDIAMKYLSKNYPTVIPTVIKFRGQTQPFASYMFADSALEGVTPLSWWLSYRGSISSLLLALVTQLFTSCASSASVERVFSTFGLVQSDLRNQLGNAKAAKLVTIYKTLNQTAVIRYKQKKKKGSKRPLEWDGESDDTDSQTEEADTQTEVNK